jgi:hypothetical protein
VRRAAIERVSDREIVRSGRRRSRDRRIGRVEPPHPARCVRVAAQAAGAILAITGRARLVTTPRLVEVGAAVEGSGVVARRVGEALHAIRAVGVLSRGAGV